MSELNLTKEELFLEIRAMMVKLFELEEEDITPQAQLFTDLDLDSIDAIDMVVQLQKRTGKKISPESFKTVKTVQDVVDAVYALLHAETAGTSA